MAKAFVFPGQGSQFPGMCRDLYDAHKEAREMCQAADRLLGFSLTDVMFNGTAEDLKQTKVTQPAVFLHSVVAQRLMTIEKPDMVAGHSLGEFSALVACGALDFDDALLLVRARAEAMQKACELQPGTMAAVIALPSASAAGCMSGEWNAPPTASLRARLAPASFIRGTTLSIPLTVPEITTCPGQLKLAATTTLLAFVGCMLI